MHYSADDSAHPASISAGVGPYRELFDASIADPEAFWAEAAREVSWIREPRRILDDTNPPYYRWFPDAELNTCANALDRHVATGRADQPALIYDSPVTGSQRTYTYAELLDETARFAGVLQGLGVGKGDRVVVYMPMIPEAVITMLACARIGAVHSVVFGGFAPHELATRIDDARPAVIVSASCGIEPSRTVQYKPMLDTALDAAQHPPRACVIVQREQLRCSLIEGRDLDWHGLMATAEPPDPVPVAATDPLYVLYTSGTTGTPKGIVRDNGGHAVALLWSMRHIYDMHPGEVFWAASDVGWVVGHSYIVYGPLLLGATTVLYEGKPISTPDPGAFWRVAAEHRVKVLFTAPTAIRAIRKEDPDGTYLGRYDLSALEPPPLSLHRGPQSAGRDRQEAGMFRAGDHRRRVVASVSRAFREGRPIARPDRPTWATTIHRGRVSPIRLVLMLAGSCGPRLLALFTCW
jgi:propionyl-CoA synthetase